MANIKAFKGIRPRKDLVEQVVAKPFDTFYTLAAKQILENNPISFLHTIEPLIANPFEQGSREEIVFKKAKEFFSVLEQLVPIHRSMKNLAKTLKELQQ